MDTIEFKGQKLNYNRQGQGKTLVLLHGFLESSKMWQALLPELITHYDCVLIDLPGHGESDTIAEIHSMQLLAEAVKAVLDSQGITKATILGHSMGGYVGLAFAELFPNILEGIILLNSTPAEDSVTRRKNRERAVELIKRYPEAFISMGITNLFAPEQAGFYAEAIKDMKKDANTFSVEGITANIKGMKIRPQRVAILKDFKGKKLIIAGQEDPIIAIEDLRRLAKHTDSKLFEVNGGHMSHMEAKQEVLNILKINLE